MGLKQYISNIWNAALNFGNALIDNTTENFAPSSSPRPYISTIFLFSSIITILFWLIYGYGAANLSYCLNKSLGNSDMQSMLWASLAFIFNVLYYPYYGIFLNPVCGSIAKKNMIGGGGRR